MEFDPTRAYFDHFIPNDLTFWTAVKKDVRRAKRILYYTKLYKKRFPDWTIRACASAAIKLVDSLQIVESWNKQNPDTQI